MLLVPLPLLVLWVWVWGGGGDGHRRLIEVDPLGPEEEDNDEDGPVLFTCCCCELLLQCGGVAGMPSNAPRRDDFELLPPAREALSVPEKDGAVAIRSGELISKINLSSGSLEFVDGVGVLCVC